VGEARVAEGGWWRSERVWVGGGGRAGVGGGEGEGHTHTHTHKERARESERETSSNTSAWEESWSKQRSNLKSFNALLCGSNT